MGSGVELPHGTLLRFTTNGIQHNAMIDNGQWLVNGKKVNSPSVAANMVGKKKDGKPCHLNGWDWWEALLPGKKRWTAIKAMRDK